MIGLWSDLANRKSLNTKSRVCCAFLKKSRSLRSRPTRALRRALHPSVPADNHQPANPRQIGRQAGAQEVAAASGASRRGTDIGRRFNIVSTEEMTSLWVSALCCTRLKFMGGERDLLARASSSERARSSISGATRINASNTSRARIPRSFLSFTLLRLKLTRDISVPRPRGQARGRVQEAFLELGKIQTIPANFTIRR